MTAADLWALVQPALDGALWLGCLASFVLGVVFVKAVAR